MVPQALLDSLSVDQRAGRWREQLADLDPPRSVCLVAEEGGEVIGFARTNPSRDADADDGTGELAAIYLRPDHWDRGVGRALLVAAAAQLAAAGFRTATLWVLTANERALAFYERSGWAADGATQITDIGGAPVPELRYRTTPG